MRCSLPVVLVCCLFFTINADETFDKLFNGGKFAEALDYAEQKIPAASRDANTWVKIAKANENIGLIEKALASYMVSWRLNPKDYESLFGTARIYNKLGQYQDALHYAQKALDEKFTAEASWEFSRACIALKKPSDAKKALEKVIESDASNVVANRELGIIYFNDAQYTQALPLLRKSFDTQADGTVAFQIGKCYLNTNAPDLAIEFLKKALEIKKPFYEAEFELCKTYIAKGNFREAVDSYAKIEGKVTLSADDYYNLATAYENLSLGSETIKTYRLAIAKFGNSQKSQALLARYKVASADIASKRFAEALENVKFVIETDPKAMIITNSYFMLADVYQGLNNTLKAIESLERAISLSANNIEGYARLAHLYTVIKQTEKARQIYEKMISLNPKDPHVFIVLGDYNLKINKFSEAQSLFERANTLEKSAHAFEGLALSAASLNQWDKAQDAAESALRMDSNRMDARIVYAQALMKYNNYKEAKEQYSILCTKMPNKLQYWQELSICYQKLNEEDNVARVDKEIIRLDKNNNECLSRYSKYLLKKGDESAAYPIFQQLADQKSNDPMVYKTLYEIANKKQDKAATLAHLKSYLTLNPNDADAHKTLGNLYYEAKSLNLALTEYRTALKIDPSITGFYKRYAEIVIAKGQQAELIKALNGIIASGEAEFGTYSTLGMIYQQQTLYAKAQAMYQKALMMQPQNLDALSALAECQEKQGNISGAIISYEQAVMLNQTADKEYKALGTLYLQQNKVAEAMKAYLRYIEKNPTDEVIARKIGEYYYDKKDYEGAIKSLVGFKGKQDFTLQFKLAESYFNTGKYENAASILSGLMNANATPEVKKKLLLMLAQSYEFLNKSNEALTVYDYFIKIPKYSDQNIAYKRAFLRQKSSPQAAIALYNQNIVQFPKDGRNYLQLGILLSKDKTQSTKAIALLEKAASLSAQDSALWNQIAELYFQIGKEDKALEAYKKYLEIYPKDINATIRMGIILLNKGKITEGLVYLETANTFSPDNEEVIFSLAKGYLQTNRTNEAIALLNKIKVKKPNDSEIRKQLYAAYLKIGDKKSAANEIGDLLKIKPDSDLMVLQAKLYIEEGNYKDAETIILNVKATNPENIEALMLLGKVLCSKKKYEEALEIYKEVIYINANYVPALYERAEVYFAQDKLQWAERFYERALRADPQFALAELGMAKLAKVRKDDAGYLLHLKNAKKLDPNNPNIKAETDKAKL